MKRGPIGLFGGTFNPIHYGHLRTALELRERLGLSEVRLLPCASPPHRAVPECSAPQRAELVSLAVADVPGLVSDARELSRRGPSYTVDTLAELRAEWGPSQSLVLIIGSDVLPGLDSWHRWRELLTLAHLIVVARPGRGLPEGGVVMDRLQQYLTRDSAVLQHTAAGSVLLQSLRPLAIAATDIRELIAAGRSPRYLLPDAVWQRIQAAGLYGYRSASTNRE